MYIDDVLVVREMNSALLAVANRAWGGHWKMGTTELLFTPYSLRFHLCHSGNM